MPAPTFTYHGQPMTGVCHLYNLTYFNERAVELAVAFEFLERQRQRFGPRRGLEVGNVLGHYRQCAHTVLDLHERPAWYQRASQPFQACHVRDAAGSWPWIVSVSTLEHVGFDTEPLEDGASVAALAHLRRCLRPGGEMLVTWPLGYNPALDELVATSSTGAKRSTQLVRAGVELWVEVPAAELVIEPYGSRDAWACGVFIGEFDRLDA